MREFEVRFEIKDENGLREKLQGLGFQNNGKYFMSDLIFESKDWVPGAVLKPGYFVVRIRLIPDQEPVLELKEMVDEDNWNETKVQIEDPRGFVEIMSRTMRPSRIISKNREEFVNGNVMVVLDEVKHLGKFIEIEGEHGDDVLKFVPKLGFDVSNKRERYGVQLFHLEKAGKIKFNPHEMLDELKRFGY